MPSIHCRCASHLNIVIENIAHSAAHLAEHLGGSFMLDLPGANWHACLIEVGGHILELFEPKHFLLHGRIGPHYLGMEYEADMDEARAGIAAHGLRVMRDTGHAVHTDPAGGFGVDYQFYGGTFYGTAAAQVTRQTRSADHWRAHPLGYTGLIGYTQAVADIAAASQFLQSFLGAVPLYEAARPAIGARAIGLQIADDICELVSPIGDGPLRREMMMTGHGIRSAIWGVADRRAARAHIENRKLRVIEGTAPGSIAIDPRDNLGLLFEFMERA